ncbi:flavodoxin domain-containing protein [Salinimonas chungwhensis]|uniref:flavodoxin domain-containing protein n=1 Tax=Salinimonas chungwhensis TaxID=265425 RepID=UPI0003A66203|nr:flavodoxin domain-containing protein [Salinimonas chungwhensis]
MSKHLSVIVGSMLGAAEYVADALEDVAKRAGYTVVIHLEPDLAEIPVDSRWVICTSTHGAGELPDNIQTFARQVKQANLDQTQAYIIGLGDSSYDTYCYGAIEMEKIILEAGASLLAPPLHIDVLNHPIPEDEAVVWFENILADQ